MKRRKFLSDSSLFVASPLIFESLTSIMLRSLLLSHSAEAAEVGLQTGRNFVNIYMPGAPMRYIFDHWIKTSNSDVSIINNEMTANSYQFSNSDITGVKTNYYTYNQTLVPYLFQQSVNVSSGSKSIAELLKSMLIIRGYGTGFDGHAFNGAVQMSPLGGAPSINGLVADYSTKTFEAIQSPARGGFGSFVSGKGKALNILPISNPLPTLLEGFRKPNKVLARNLKESQAEAFDKAKRSLASLANSSTKSSQILHTNLSNAELLIKKGVGNIVEYWSEAFPRYKNIIDNAVRTKNIAEINDKPIVSTESEKWNVQEGGNQRTFAKDQDLRSSLDNATINLLAEGLALVEYVLTENLAQSVEIFSTELSGLKATFVGQEQPSVFSHNSDMHSTGSHSNIILMNSYYRGYTAGVLELIDKLTIKNIWKNTMIQTSCEFGRTTRSSFSGSDHGFNQMITSVISGFLQDGPYVVGNVLKSGHSNDYMGTQGIGAEIRGYTQKGRPTPLAPASTIVELLGIEKNPYVNLAAPLVKLNSSGLIYEFEKGKIIDG